jgi:hypothetical protein
MEKRNDILSELQSISPTVAEISPVNPFQVPEGYFESFDKQILALTKEPQLSAVFLNPAVNPYKVPADYFELLPEQILSIVKNDRLGEVLKNRPANPYEVPNGYFESLAETVLSRAKAQNDVSPRNELESLSSLLSSLDKTIPFTIPDRYFEDLSGNVVAGVKAVDFVNEELENLSPLMSSLRSENVYQVPAEYFNALPAKILKRAKKQKPAKVVSMTFGQKAMRYAAAAVVIGVVITTAILFMSRQNESATSGSYAQVEERIQSETQSKLKGVSDDELLNFVENQMSSLPDIVNFALSDDIDDEDVRLMLADIPDAELEQYLSEYSDENEVLTN